MAAKAEGNPSYKITRADKAEPQYQSAYSDAKAGQKKYGGWYQSGRERFQSLEKKFRYAKRKDHVEDLENEILALIQKEEKIGTGKKKHKERSLDEFEERDDWRQVGVESDALVDTEGEEESDDDEFEITYGQQKKSPTKKARKTAAKEVEEDDEEDGDDKDEDEDEEEEEGGDD